MGEAIATSSPEPEDYAAFRERLRHELAILDELVEGRDFRAGGTSIGAEVEMALVDRDMRPARVNEDVLAALSGESGPDGVSPELIDSASSSRRRRWHSRATRFRLSSGRCRRGSTGSSARPPSSTLDQC